MMKEVLGSIAWVVALFGVLSGCAGFQPGPKPAAGPEVTIPGMTKGEVLFALTELMTAKGYIFRGITGSRAVYYKRTYSLYAAPPIDQRATPEKYVPPSSIREPQPEARVIYDITEGGGGVRIAATLLMIRFPEGPFKEVTDISSERDGQTIQDYLDQLKASVAQ